MPMLQGVGEVEGEDLFGGAGGMGATSRLSK